MGRLTRKKEDRFFENEEFWVSAEEPSIDKIDDVYFRLAELEDLLEDLGVESVEELKDHLSICGILHDEQFIKEPDIWKLRLYRIERNRCRIARQENQALKDRWENLKELLEKDMEHNSKEYDESLCSAFKHYSATENWVLDRMEELEKED